jgi:hypothetical protein
MRPTLIDQYIDILKRRGGELIGSQLQYSISLMSAFPMSLVVVPTRYKLSAVHVYLQIITILSSWFDVAR